MMPATYVFLKQQRDVELVRRFHHRPQTFVGSENFFNDFSTSKPRILPCHIAAVDYRGANQESFLLHYVTVTILPGIAYRASSKPRYGSGEGSHLQRTLRRTPPKQGSHISGRDDELEATYSVADNPSGSAALVPSNTSTSGTPRVLHKEVCTSKKC